MAKKRGMGTGAKIALGVAGLFALAIYMVPHRSKGPRDEWKWGPQVDSEGRVSYGWNWMGAGEPTKPMPTHRP